MRKLLAILAFILFSVPAFSAVAVSDGGTKRWNNNNTSATSISLTTYSVTAGSNLCMIAILQLNGSVTSPAITWNGVALSNDGANVAGTVIFWHLVNPATGTNTLAASWTTNRTSVLGAVTFSGADQTTCINATNSKNQTGSSISSSIALTSTTDGATVSGGVCGTQYPTGGTSATNLWAPTTSDIGWSSSYQLGGTTNTHTTTWAASCSWGERGVNVIAEGGGATCTPSLTLIGVGAC